MMQVKKFFRKICYPSVAGPGTFQENRLVFFLVIVAGGPATFLSDNVVIELCRWRYFTERKMILVLLFSNPNSTFFPFYQFKRSSFQLLSGIVPHNHLTCCFNLVPSISCIFCQNRETNQGRGQIQYLLVSHVTL